MIINIIYNSMVWVDNFDVPKFNMYINHFAPIWNSFSNEPKMDYKWFSLKSRYKILYVTESRSLYRRKINKLLDNLEHMCMVESTCNFCQYHHVLKWILICDFDHGFCSLPGDLLKSHLARDRSYLPLSASHWIK